MKLTLFLLALTSCAALAVTEEQTNKTFQVSPGGTLVVDVDFGSIDVSHQLHRRRHRQRVAESHPWQRGGGAKIPLRNPVVFVQEGNTVTVRSRLTVKEKFHWFGGFRNRNEAKYTIRVPARFSARLNTSGGGIAASDLTGEVKANTSGGGLRFARLHGPLNGDTSGGGIHVTDCEGTIKVDTSGGGIEVTGGSGSLDGDTSGGSITVKNFKGPASVSTSGGSITIENVAGKVKGGTSGGSIHAALLSPVPDDVSLSTSGGRVTVNVPADAAFNLDAESSGGGVHCDLPVTVQGQQEHNRLKGPVNGGGPVLRLETSGGGVHVQQL